MIPAKSNVKEYNMKILYALTAVILFIPIFIYLFIYNLIIASVIYGIRMMKWSTHIKELMKLYKAGIIQLGSVKLFILLKPKHNDYTILIK